MLVNSTSSLVESNSQVFILYIFIFLTDIDECRANTHDCHSSATCTNTEGSFNCSCNEGYFGNGKACYGALLHAQVYLVVVVVVVVVVVFWFHIVV